MVNNTLLIIVNNNYAIINAENIIVPKNGGGNNNSIQNAIDNASSGDIIYIWADTFYENLVINKSVELVGNGTSKTIIDGQGLGSVIKIFADNVTIRNFTLLNSGNAFSGIEIYGSITNSVAGCRIMDNELNNNGYGISLWNSDNNYLEGNKVVTNTYGGIQLKNSVNNYLNTNTIKKNHNGIYLDSSDENIIKKNNIISNENQGLFLSFSYDNKILNNEIILNNMGIELLSSLNNNITDNLIKENRNKGISLEASSNNNIINNTIRSNGDVGISLQLEDSTNSYNWLNVKSGPGKTFYVATDGNDSNNGISQLTAWRTLKYASSQAMAGDTVYIKKGNYSNDELWPSNSGNSTHPISFIGYDTVPGDDPKKISNMPMIDGVTGNGLAVYINWVNHIVLKNLYIWRVEQGIWVREGDNNIIMNSHTADLGYGGYSGRGLVLQGSANSILYSCTVINAHAQGITLSQAINCTVMNCTVTSHPSGGGGMNSTDYYIVLGYSYNNLIEDCKIGNYHAPGTAHVGHGFIIKDTRNDVDWPHSHNNIFRKCIALTPFGEAFSFAHKCHNNTFVDCTMRKSNITRTGHGIVARNGAHHNYWDNITILNVTSGFYICWFSPEDKEVAPHHNIFRNIIVKDVENVFTLMYGSNTNTFTNSVIYNATTLIRLRRAGHKNLTIQNSIIHSVKNKEFVELTENISDLNISNSCFYNSGFNSSDTTNVNIINSIDSDPLFANISEGDFHLLSQYGRWDGVKWVYDNQTSPCIDIGDPNIQYRLEPQPNGGRINIGAYGNTKFASKSSENGKYGYFEHSIKNTINKNNIHSNSGDGIELKDSSMNIVSSNVIIDNNNGIFVQTSKNNDIKNNSVKTSKDNGSGIYFKGSSYNTIIDNQINATGTYSNGFILLNSVNNNFSSSLIRTSGDKSDGILISNSNNNWISNSEIIMLGDNANGYILQGKTGFIINTTITTKNCTNCNDIITAGNGTITAINCSFNTQELTKNGGGVLKIINFLGVKVLNYDGFTPISEVDVLIIDNNKTIYASTGYHGFQQKTDENGFIGYIPITDRWYIHNNIPIENITSIKIKKIQEISEWEEVIPYVDMKTSHIERIIPSDLLPPITPSGLVIKRIPGTNTLNISWDHSINALNYTIYSNKSGQWGILEDLTYPKNWILDIELLDDITYYYRIRAWNRFGISSNLSDIASYHLRNIKPTIPIGLQILRIPNTNTLNISWIHNINNINYTIFTNKSGQWDVLKNVTYPKYWLLDTNLQDELTYYYRIQSWNEYGISSPLSIIISFYLTDITPPKTPTGFKAESIKTNDIIKITWSPNFDDTISYELWRKGPFIEQWILLSNIKHPTSFLEWSDPSLYNGSTHYFKIRAKDKVGLFSSFSSPVNVTHIDRKAPAPPKNLTAIGVSNSKIILYWQLSKDLDVVGYKIYINKSGFGSGGPYIYIGFDKSFSYILTDLSPNTTYYFVVSAIDEANNTSPFTNEAWNHTQYLNLPKEIITIPYNNSMNVPVDVTVLFIFPSAMDKDSVEDNIKISPEEDFLLIWKNDWILELKFLNNLNYDDQYTIFLDSIVDKDKIIFDNENFILTFRTIESIKIIKEILILNPHKDQVFPPNEIINITGIVIGFEKDTDISITVSDKTKTTNINDSGYWSISIEVPGSPGDFKIEITIENITKLIPIIINETEEISKKDNETHTGYEYVITLSLVLIVFISSIIIILFYNTKNKNDEKNEFDIKDFEEYEEDKEFFQEE
jgi:parallel beta-helix repeat protein